ncbi:MAG: nuclear transport factor 2 family protein [Actinobacteria bacterium]|nr:nuclear transport factor 2 family protein [Actinomycetota bacterium]
MPVLEPRDAHVELQRLVAAYGLAADDRDADWFVSLWLPGATLSVFDGEEGLTGTYEGADALRGVTEALGRYARTVHLVSTHRVEVAADGTSATGKTYCTAHHLVRPVGEVSAWEDRVMTIRYDDRYGRDGSGAWRFAARECHKLFVRSEAVVEPGGA